MNAMELILTWEKIRNEDWAKQEMFVRTLIQELIICRNSLHFLANDKYVSNTSFKHCEGTVGEHCNAILSDFRERIERAVE